MSSSKGNTKSEAPQSQREEASTQQQQPTSSDPFTIIGFLKRPANLFALLAVLTALSWTWLDANLSLFLYDLVSLNSYANIQNKTIWVTGASSGIGAEIVCLLMQAEARHVILSARSPERIEAVVQMCRDRGKTTTLTATTFSIVPYDASSLTADYEHVVQSALESAGSSIDMLVLNAGIYQLSPALDASLEQTQKVMRVNFESPVALSTALMRANRWKERGRGQLLVVSSLMGRGGHGLASSYVASKHALRGYFASLSTEESSWLTVTLALPGATDTNLWSTNFAAPVASSGDNTHKLSPQRCARLVLKSAVGPYWLLYETWITKQPGLLWVNLAAYLPDVFHWTIHLLGRLRVAVFQEDGSDALDIVTLLRQLPQL